MKPVVPIMPDDIPDTLILIRQCEGKAEGKWIIIIAHRLATVRRADDILILDEGRVHEHGPRRDLEKDPNSRFSELLRTGLTEVLS